MSYSRNVALKHGLAVSLIVVAAAVAACRPPLQMETLQLGTRLNGDNTLATHTTVLGGPRQVPVPGDYDGDRQDDLAVYDLDRGTWSILHSSGRLEIVTFGAGGQTPVPFDFDGDGRLDLATYQPSTGLWTIRPSSSGIMKNFVLGTGGSVPVPLDFDGDGRTDAAFYQPSTGHWRIRLSGPEALVDVDYALGTPLN